MEYIICNTSDLEDRKWRKTFKVAEETCQGEDSSSHLQRLAPTDAHRRPASYKRKIPKVVSQLAVPQSLQLPPPRCPPRPQRHARRRSHLRASPSWQGHQISYRNYRHNLRFRDSRILPYRPSYQTFCFLRPPERLARPPSHTRFIGQGIANMVTCSRRTTRSC